MHYYAYEMAHAVVSPLRFSMQALRHTLDWPFNPMAHTSIGKNVRAACEVFENVTRRYGKPEFAIRSTQIDGITSSVVEEIVLAKPFCNLVHFRRDPDVTAQRHDPKVLLVAPMSGHYATLLRGTVEAMLREHEVYITDWVDARDIPLALGRFDFNDFVDYVIDMVRFIGPDTHVIAVCQPAVPSLVAAAVMASRNDDIQPASLVLMGGPIDTRRNPTKVNELAATRSIDWFENNVISTVPFPHAGFLRPVYPGFMQLTGFMTMNLERHMNAHMDLFKNLVQGDCDSVKQHQDFYEEYLSVMDLTAEFYLQTVKTVFQDHSLPNRTLSHRGEYVDCSAIRTCALMTVEGERDDICGLGQTEAAQELCSRIPDEMKVHYVQPGVGHYGVFNGTRWRTEIQPRIREFIRTAEYRRKKGSRVMATGTESVKKANGHLNGANGHSITIAGE